MTKLTTEKLKYHREYYKKTHEIIKENKLKVKLERYEREIYYFFHQYSENDVNSFIEQFKKFHPLPQKEKQIEWFENLINRLLEHYEKKDN